MDREEFLQKVEETHSINLEESDVLVWSFPRDQGTQQLTDIQDILETKMPDTQHIAITGLEELYKIRKEEVVE